MLELRHKGGAGGDFFLRGAAEGLGLRVLGIGAVVAFEGRQEGFL